MRARPVGLWCDHGWVTENAANAGDEVVSICSDLIRIDTTNPGDHSGPGERAAAEHVAGAHDRSASVPRTGEGQ